MPGSAVCCRAAVVAACLSLAGCVSAGFAPTRGRPVEVVVVKTPPPDLLEVAALEVFKYAVLAGFLAAAGYCGFGRRREEVTTVPPPR